MAHGQMDEQRARGDDARLPARRGRRARRDDDHRVGPRHPAGQHADRRARRPARPRAALPDPRPRRAAPASAPTPTCSTPRAEALTEEAAARLATLSDYTELGSGFKIAMRDLEIRGAGNLLGDEQSGHVAAVGFELYVQMLDEAVAELRAARRGPSGPSEPVRLDVDVDAYVPADYIPYEAAKIDVHRRIAGAREPGELRALRDELEDRFGPLPEPVENLIALQQARIKLGHAGARSVEFRGGRLVVDADRARLRAGRAPARAGPRGDLRVAREHADAARPRRRRARAERVARLVAARRCALGVARAGRRGGLTGRACRLERLTRAASAASVCCRAVPCRRIRSRSASSRSSSPLLLVGGGRARRRDDAASANPGCPTATSPYRRRTSTTGVDHPGRPRPRRSSRRPAQSGLPEGRRPPDDPQYDSSSSDQAMQSLILADWIEGEADRPRHHGHRQEVEQQLAADQEAELPEREGVTRSSSSSRASPRRTSSSRSSCTLLQRQDPSRRSSSDSRRSPTTRSRTYYDANKSTASRSRRRRDLRIILTKTQAKAEQAKQALEADDSDASWKKVAEQYSTTRPRRTSGGAARGPHRGPGRPAARRSRSSRRPRASSSARSRPTAATTSSRSSAITPETTQPLDEAERRDQAAARLRQAAADRHRLPDRLRRQVDAADRLRADDDDRALQQLRAPEAEPRPGQPTPPAVISRQPIEPGTSTISIDGSAQQGLPQGPQPPPTTTPRPGAARRRAARPDGAPTGARPDDGRAARHGAAAGDAGAAAPRRRRRLSRGERRRRRAPPPVPRRSPSSTRSPGGCAASAPGTASRTSARSSRTRSRRPTSSPTPPHAGDDAKLLDELGDVLFQVHFLSLLLEERGAGDLAAVAEHCREKLIRRHPHVFGEVEAPRRAGEVRCATGTRSSASEEGARGGPLRATCPRTCPALLYARKVQRRAASAGCDVDGRRRRRSSGELERARRAGAATSASRERVREVGDVLFAAVDVARKLASIPSSRCGGGDRFRGRVEARRAAAPTPSGDAADDATRRPARLLRRERAIDCPP